MYQYQSMHVFGQKKNLMKCKAGLSVLWYDRTPICPLKCGQHHFEFGIGNSDLEHITASTQIKKPMRKFSCMARHVWGTWKTSYRTSRVLLHWTKSFSFMSQIKSTSTSSSLWSCFFAAYSTLCRDHWSDLFVYEMYFLIYNNAIIG